MRYLSVCSGIEAASVAWAPLGWSAVAFSEIEKFPSAVLAHHYPTVPNLGDMTEMDVEPLGPIDILVGGTPCQAFSVAGLRQSLGDARGNLTLSYVRLIHELVEHHGLRNAVWENVPGVLSTKDNAFGCFLGAIVGSDEPLIPSQKPADGKSDARWKQSKKLGRHVVKWSNSGLVSGPKGRAAWTIKDAQYFGLAQRRRRVFVVSDFGNGADPAAVLFEFEGVRGNPAPSREARKDVAPTISARTKGGGGLGTDFDLDGGLIQSKWPAEVASTLNAHYGDKWGLEDQHALGGAALFVPVTHAIQAGALRENPDSGPDGVGVQADIAYTLEARAEVQAVSFTQNSRSEVRFINGDGTIVGALAAEPGAQQQNYVAQTVALRGREGGATAELGGEIATALRASTGGGDKPHVLTSAVRRLTPVECERLQGFPDDYTRIPMPKKGKKVGPVWAADGPRYKALGNSMAVPVMRWIGERIDRFMPREEALVRKALRFRADGRMEFV